LSYLLDTDILSNTLKKQPSPALVARIAETPRSQQFTSSITVGEMLYGALKSSRREELLSRLASVIWPAIPIVPFDRDAAEVYGRIRVDLEHRGLPLPEADMRIAAIAVSRNMIVVTGNVRHFDRITGLAVENWL
jgi:tRNA(fMet)-specific endonuclease VapC